MATETPRTFYVLESSGPRIAHGLFATEIDPLDDAVSEGEHCPFCGQMRGGFVSVPPVRVDVELRGREFGDIAFMPGMELAVSDRFRAAFLRDHLRGIHGFDDIHVRRTVSNDPSNQQLDAPLYFLARPSFSGARVDDLRSGVSRRGLPRCQWCIDADIIRIDRVFLDLTHWHDEDIFVARGLDGVYVVTDRFRQWILRNNITNAYFVNALEFHYDYAC